MTTTTRIELGMGGLVLPTERPAGLLIRWALLGWVGLLGCAACLLIWRRAAGALSSPLPAGGLAIVGLVSALVTAAVRAAWRAALPPKINAIVWGVLTVSLVTAAIAVSVPDSSHWGIALLWAAILAEEGWAWRPGSFRGALGGEPRRPAADRSSPPAAIQPASEWAFQDPPQENVTQQLTRIEEPNGTERLQGWLRTAFAAGQRLASVHVAFCPPFSHGPDAHLKQLAGPEVRIKKVQVFPFGARFDLKLAAPAETPLEVLLQLSAEASGKEPRQGAVSGEKPETETGELQGL